MPREQRNPPPGFEQPAKKKQSGLARFFLRGVVTLAPVVLTIVVFGLLFQVVNRYVTGPINSVIYWSLENTALGWKGLDRLRIDPFDKAYLDPNLLPLDLQDTARSSPEGYSYPHFQNQLRDYRHEHLGFFRDLEELAINKRRLRDDVRRLVNPLFGVLVSLLLVLWLGWLVGGFVGRRIVQRLDRAMHVIPVVNAVYPYTKQLVDFFFAERKLEFDTVVAVPYPSPGIWSLGFVTGSALRSMREETGLNLVSVFVPSSPMPMTGYTIFLEGERLIPMPISIDEALRITMTGGVLVPPDQAAVADPIKDLAVPVPPAGQTSEPEARERLG